MVLQPLAEEAIMASPFMSTQSNRVALVGDACLFTAAATCLTVGLIPLALIIGPAAAWWLHGRRIDRQVVIGGAVGIIVSLVAVAGLFGLVALVSGALGSVGGSEFSVPIAILGAMSGLFIVLVGVLDFASLRDLVRTRRTHVRLDIIRLMSTLIIGVAAVAVTLIQVANPDSEVGELGIFVLGAAVAGAVTMAVGNAIVSYTQKRHNIEV
jgi:hypothetical protein